MTLAHVVAEKSINAAALIKEKIRFYDQKKG